jgi:hypothetical protein
VIVIAGSTKKMKLTFAIIMVKAGQHSDNHALEDEDVDLYALGICLGKER